MEPLGATYAKAIDDLSGKIFIPALISALLVEIGPTIQSYMGLNLAITYAFVCILGLLLAPIILFFLMEVSIRLFNGRDIGPEIGVIIMPLGFAGVFPDQFKELGIPYTQVTGVATLAWSFMLVKGKKFFYGHFWSNE